MSVLQFYMSSGPATVKIRTDDDQTTADAVVLINPSSNTDTAKVDFHHPNGGVLTATLEPGDPDAVLVLDPPLIWDAENGDFGYISTNLATY